MSQVISRPPANKKARQPRPVAAAEVSRPWAPALLLLAIALGGSVLLWAAFPPLNWPWLAWVAPMPWLWLVRLPELRGRRPYLILWVAGLVYWLAMLYGVRLAHPALNAGWIALSAYLAVYLPIFVGLTRVAVHRLKISLVVAAPIVWVGLELLRGHLITGFSLSLLAHTQAGMPMLIQVADLAGGYTLSFVIMLVAACLARLIPLNQEPFRLSSLWPVAPAAAAVACTIGYGQWRLGQAPAAQRPAMKVALIQGSIDTVFEPRTREKVRATYDHYNTLMDDAVTAHRDLDLVIWPESMFVIDERLVEEPLTVPPEAGASAEEFRTLVAGAQSEFAMVLAAEAARANQNNDPAGKGAALIIGGNTWIYGSDRPRVYNSALLADRQGKIVGRYYKTHAVMFGEYIPFGDAVPFLYKLTPLPGGMSIGDGPKAFEVAGLRMSPSICFESTVPHLIRGQVVDLARRGQPVDVLVNITNDGWFWGSSILDQHLRCGVFRAVENRKPMVIAANTGFSASIDGNGIVRKQGPRRGRQALIDEVQPDGRQSPYHVVGDLPANLCALACLGLVLIGFRRKREEARHQPE